MVEITESAYEKLLTILSDNLHISSGYGSPPIFYWYRNMMMETQKIKTCRYLRKGEYNYQLGYSLGVARVMCDYIGKKRILLITDYDINTKVLFTWGTQKSNSGIIQNIKETPKPKLKGYHKLTSKPLFGYSFVMNNKKEYNLIDKNGNLITRWFRNIKPLSKPYGKHQIIAYINVGGYLCALGYDGQIYDFNMLWNNVYLSECINHLIQDAMKNIQRQTLNESRDNIIRIKESQLHSIIKEIVQCLVA